MNNVIVFTRKITWKKVYHKIFRLILKRKSEKSSEDYKTQRDEQGINIDDLHPQQGRDIVVNVLDVKNWT